MTLADIAREIGGDIEGNTLRACVEGVDVEVRRTNRPLTSHVAYDLRVFCDYVHDGPHSAGPDELLVVTNPVTPIPTLPGHVFGGRAPCILYASSMGEPTIEDVVVTLHILAAIANTPYRIRFEAITFAEAKRRERIAQWKRRAPRIVFVAAVTLIAFLIRRR